MTLAVSGFAYLLGLSNYGVADEGTAYDADTGHQVRSPGQLMICYRPSSQPGSAPHPRGA